MGAEYTRELDRSKRRSIEVREDVRFNDVGK